MVGAPTEDACPAIDGFEVLRRIGEGNAGDVFEAIRLGPEGFRKPVAIKRLAVGRTRDRKALDRFLREARISARLDHPNIVRVEELLITEEGHFLVMELLRGRTLLELCRHLPTAPMPRELALAVASQALDGLAHAHALSDEQGRPLGLVHRDLTPRNLFVRTSGVVKILDFGIAKLRLAMNTGLTGEGRVLGTLDFLSPEQARGEEVDARSDLYQVGAVLYYLLSGKTPHGALATEELVERAARECPPPLDVLRPELPARVVALVARALELEPESRFPDAEAMRGAIEDAREDGAAMGPREIERLMAGLSVASESQTETIGEAVAARPELKPDVRTGRDPLVGRTLGGFVLREKIGQGGFGVVYRAEQPALHREAVVKVLLARDAGEQAIERFFREAHLASSLDHPYAAHIYELGAEPDGVLWIAMELVRGTPLSTFLEVQGALSPERFAPLLVRICEVVEAAHERGIVHRDLKPANVMVIVRSGRILPKLLDFGISKLVESAPPGDVGASGPEPGGVVEEPSLTQRGLLIGSPPYMAPEQWRDPHAADARADLYALGVLAYEAISGHRPFDGDRMELRRKHLSEPPPPLGPNFPPELDAVLKRALAKRPEDRYESALDR